ncbi:MAG TPA: TIGR03790 family protein, partial [Candidatus Sulfopaludibacter sp.]|nr:TIGR03790 family protein [Candidatus Sulfopaludibacter sp.]
MALYGFLLLALASTAIAQTAENVLLVVNGNSPVSRQIADYYRPRRSIPLKNVCRLATVEDEEIVWETYQRQIETPIGECLKKNGLQEKVLYIVTTLGLPLKVDGLGSGTAAEHASVDSELTLLYAKLKGEQFVRAGALRNPFFGKRDFPFRHPQFPMYLVTRLAAYDVAGVKAMIDRGLKARNRGKFIIDAGKGSNGEGNNWLRNAATLLPADRVILHETPPALYGQKDVIGYASWGSNDGARKQRWLGYQWLPGAVATEFVSTNARTFKRPPDTWNITSYQDTTHFFGGSPQGLSADLIHEGATGASGNVYEPYLTGCVRPDYLLPAWLEGRT